MLSPGVVDIWCVDLTTVPDDATRVLCVSERERAARIVAPPRSLRWARSRAVLRLLLARYLRADARRLAFASAASGKPALVTLGRLEGSAAPRQRQSGSLFFNLSHSAEIALYAISADAPLGVDIETCGRRRDFLSPARRLFGQSAARRLQTLDFESREREFLRAWVHREAALKCFGSGIGGTPCEGQLWVEDLPPLPSAVAALALSAEPPLLQCWTWSP